MTKLWVAVCTLNKINPDFQIRQPNTNKILQAMKVVAIVMMARTSKTRLTMRTKILLKVRMPSIKLKVLQHNKTNPRKIFLNLPEWEKCRSKSLRTRKWNFKGGEVARYFKELKLGIRCQKRRMKIRVWIQVKMSLMKAWNQMTKIQHNHKLMNSSKVQDNKARFRLGIRFRNLRRSRRSKCNKNTLKAKPVRSKTKRMSLRCRFPLNLARKKIKARLTLS